VVRPADEGDAGVGRNAAPEIIDTRRPTSLTRAQQLVRVQVGGREVPGPGDRGQAQSEADERREH